MNRLLGLLALVLLGVPLATVAGLTTGYWTLLLLVQHVG